MPAAAPISILAMFQQNLVGNWENRDFGALAGVPVGGPENPLSYNIMPLPQTTEVGRGYILKNFRYHEKLHFNSNNPATDLAIAARAPNRGGGVNQDARALFYEQQVKFAEGPQGPRPVSPDGDVVHVENGAWLWLPRFVQQTGPYPSNPPAPGTTNPPGDELTNPPEQMVNSSVQQPADILIAKQISIPHGNSILALGSFDTVPNPDGSAGPWKGNPLIAGSPIIPDGLPPYPTAAAPDTSATGTPIPPAPVSVLDADIVYGPVQVGGLGDPNDYQNPHPDLTLSPNKPLQQAVAIIQPDHYMHWRVTTQPLLDGTGVVTNIPFERRVSDVTAYSAEYWMLFKGQVRYLAYTQTIIMVLIVKGNQYVFPHLTCNTVTFCD